MFLISKLSKVSKNRSIQATRSISTDPNPGHTKRYPSKRYHIWVIVIAFSLLLSGCGTENLYTRLSETDANEMIAILAQHNIQTTKVAGEENSWNIQVPTEQFAQAVDILKTQGLPRDKFTDLSEEFKKSGLVSSPEEERIRFMSALSQQIAETLTHIDGVLTARVIINLPNNDPMADKIQPSSASVFIRYKSNADLQSAAFQIKTLVSNSVEGLSFDKVSLAMFPADDTSSNPNASSYPKNGNANPAAMKSVLSMQVSPQSASRLQLMLTTAGILLTLALAAAVYFFMKSRNAGSQTSSGISTALGLGSSAGRSKSASANPSRSSGPGGGATAGPAANRSLPLGTGAAPTTPTAPRSTL